MDQRHVTIYTSTKAYVRASGEIVRHVSNRRYTPKLRQYTDDECKTISNRISTGEKLTAVAAEYGLSYARARSVLKKWRDRQVADTEDAGAPPSDDCL